MAYRPAQHAPPPRKLKESRKARETPPIKTQKYERGSKKTRS